MKFIHECLNGPTSASNILYSPESMNNINFNMILRVVPVHIVEHFQRPGQGVDIFFGGGGRVKEKGGLVLRGANFDSRVNFMSYLTCLLITIPDLYGIDFKKYMH